MPHLPEITLGKTKYKQYLRNARKRNLSMELSEDHAVVLFNLPCAYCGAAPSFDSVQGIDRVDSQRGYSLDNCVPACRTCNTMKWDFDLAHFYDQAARIGAQRHRFARRKKKAQRAALLGYKRHFFSSPAPPVVARPPPSCGPLTLP